MPATKKVWWHGYRAQFARPMEGFLEMQFARGERRACVGRLRSAGVLRRKPR
jgi:hypothetical protein